MDTWKFKSPIVCNASEAENAFEVFAQAIEQLNAAQVEKIGNAVAAVGNQMMANGQKPNAFLAMLMATLVEAHDALDC